MQVLPETRTIDGAGRGTASARSSVSPANHEFQQGGAVARVSRRSAQARFLNPAGPNISSLAAGNSGGVMTLAPGLSFDAIRLPAGLVQHLPTHPVLKFLRGRWAFHFSKRLSSLSSSDGFKTNRKALTCEAQPLSSDDKIHD